MVALLLILLIPVLGFTHYSAFKYGQRRMDRHLYYRYYRPLLRRHVRVVDRILEASLDDTATAQQRNVKLLTQNAVLRGKAIRHALNYRDATRHLRRKVSPLQKILWVMSAVTHAQRQFERLSLK